MQNYKIYSTPPPAPAPRAMDFPNLRSEWKVGREAVRLGLSSPQLFRAPRGHGEPVLLLPGFRAPESSMFPIRRLLRLKGYDANTWGLGVNQGDVQRYVDALKPVVKAKADSAGRAVALVGWSLGGVVSREIAREIPEHVSTVVTYGTPVIGGPSFTVGAKSYSAADREHINKLIEERNAVNPIKIPLAIIFTRGDTIVSWPACIDRYSLQATHYEVDSTHFSMGIDPTVWGIVLERLHQVHQAG
ncbi:esterase/lipase family protein [Congregibacter sp.]|uniref:esterase/lipase family protein n=1 Tax=Congregibacter sp. TaxID=2744308 RepID=UPI003F6D4C0B